MRMIHVVVVVVLSAELPIVSLTFLSLTSNKKPAQVFIYKDRLHVAFCNYLNFSVCSSCKAIG